MRWLLLATSVIVASTALGQGSIRIEVTGDALEVPAGRTTVLRATVRNTSSATLQGGLNISVSLEDAIFEAVSSSDPALTCTKTAGHPNKHNCVGPAVTMLPNGTITITIVARVPVGTEQGKRLTLIGTAAGFEGQVASGLFSFRVIALGVDLTPKLFLSAATLEVTVFPDGQILDINSKERPLESGGVVRRGEALMVQVVVENIGDLPTDDSWFVDPTPPPTVNLDRRTPPVAWPGCANDFPRWRTYAGTTIIPPGGQVTLCQVFLVLDGAFALQMSVETIDDKDQHPANNKDVSDFFGLDHPRQNDRTDPFTIPALLRTRGRR